MCFKGQACQGAPHRGDRDGIYGLMRRHLAPGAPWQHWGGVQWGQWGQQGSESEPSREPRADSRVQGSGLGLISSPAHCLQNRIQEVQDNRLLILNWAKSTPSGRKEIKLKMGQVRLDLTSTLMGPLLSLNTFAGPHPKMAR